MDYLKYFIGFYELTQVQWHKAPDTSNARMHLHLNAKNESPEISTELLKCIAHFMAKDFIRIQLSWHNSNEQIYLNHFINIWQCFANQKLNDLKVDVKLNNKIKSTLCLP